VSVDADFDGLVELWTLLEPERVLVQAKYAGARLGFALQLKGFVAAGQFPSGVEDFSSEAVAFMAKQLRVDVAELDHYDVRAPRCPVEGTLHGTPSPVTRTGAVGSRRRAARQYLSAV
jgi:hypothetical protein